MIVFAGPSIAGVELPSASGIELRSPVRQGDVYLAALERPAAIGIIDGYFDGMPSVWHKEILWAMAQGIPVLGAASMGALRAAELDVFGMVGVGAIYRAYRDGDLKDDDEVALVHGPQDLDYVGLSVAMVTVRATGSAAVAAGVLTNRQATHLVSIAKAQFYKTRSWESILQAMDPHEVPRDRLQEFKTWIETNEVDQKAHDAQELLDRMAERKFEPPVPDYHFESTDLWVRTTERWRRQQEQDLEPEGPGYRLLGSLDRAR